MAKLLLGALALVGVALAAPRLRPTPSPAPIERLQAEENRRFVAMCRRTP